MDPFIGLCEIAKNIQLSPTTIGDSRCVSDTSYDPMKKQKISDDFCLETHSNESDPKCFANKSEVKRRLKRWTSEEDKTLIELLEKYGNNWEEIAKHMPGRAASGVKNRYYWIYNNSRSSTTVQKIKQSFVVKKMYKENHPSELFRKINDYIREECIYDNFLALDKPESYSHLLCKLKMSPQELEKFLKMQFLLDKAQQLYISCIKAKENLDLLKNQKTPNVNS